MTYRSLLVHLDQDPLCAERTQVAIRLARELDCHLAGVAPTGVLRMPTPPEAALSDLAALAWDSMVAQAQQAAQRFTDSCSAVGLRSVETVVDEGDEALSLVRRAHCSDLTVLSQPDPSDPEHRRRREIVEQVILQSARPTLVLPYAGRFERIGTHALVAWDDSREAARALADALPLLRRAARVDVVSWNERGVEADEGLRARLDALLKWLLWQGVAAEPRVETTEIDIGNAMLSRAADYQADLIVMGAYGHARWTERVLGGATRGLLDAMTVPVLMSH